MPGASCHVLVDMQVAMREDVQAGTFLVRDQHRHRILKLLAEPHIEHARVQRTAPHAYVVPAGTRKRTRSCAGQNQIGCGGEHETSNGSFYFAPAANRLPEHTHARAFVLIARPDPIGYDSRHDSSREAGDT